MKIIKVAAVAGHTTIGGKDRGAEKYVIEGIANRQQMLAFASKLSENPKFQVFVEPEGLDLKGEIAWVNKINPDIAIAFHNNAGGGDYWVALCSVTGSTDAFARIAEAKFKALGYRSNGIVKRKNSSGGNWYGFIRQTKCPAIIFETAFVDNPTSAAKIDTLVENEYIGRVYAEAVGDYYGASVNAGSKTSITPSQLSGDRYMYALPTKEVFPMGRKFVRVHPDVRKWQAFCTWMGYPTDLDGIFGRDTERVTKIVQGILGTAKDGVVGADTISKASAYRK